MGGTGWDDEDGVGPCVSTARLQGFSTAFDAAFEEIWLAFSAGATLVASTNEMMRSGADLVDTLKELRITLLDTTPTNLQAVAKKSSQLVEALAKQLSGS